MKKTILLLVSAILALGCHEDPDDNTTPLASVAFNFTHHWDDTLINSSNLQTEIVTNENGEVLSMSRIRYLISKFQLTNTQGDIYTFDGYKFTDMSDETTYNFTPEINNIPIGTYTLSFVWGFNEADNIDGEYEDLNGLNWSWPANLGGGYHFLQFDGMYNVDTTASSPFNYHHGTARVSDGVFEQNFAVITLDTPITISNDVSIEVEMNIAEFFKNPNTWDLNVLDTPLMPNYDAQKMMQDNVMTVFSLGEISIL